MPHLERLQNLRRVITTIDPLTLDMGSWDCGTTACVAGHACRDAWHNDQGLRASNKVLTPGYKDHRSYQALMNFYELSVIQAWEIFSPVLYSANLRGSALRDEVLVRIDFLIEEASGRAAR